MSKPRPAASHAPSPLTEAADKAAHLDDRTAPLLVVIDRSGTIVALNPACEHVTGWQTAEVRGRPIWTTLFSSASAAEARRALEASVAPDPLADWVTRDGQQLGVSWAVAPLPGEHGERVVVALNLAGVAAAEVERRESAVTLHTLAQTTAAAIFIHRDAQLLYVNPAAEALTEYSRDELLRTDFWSLVHPTMREAARQQAAARLRGEPVPVRNEVKIATKTGAERWVEFSAAVVAHRGEAAAVGTAFDITERKRASARQRERERRFEALIEHSSDVVSVVAIDARLTYVGPSISRVLGHAPQDLEGRSILDLVHQDDRSVMRQAMREAMANPGQPITVHYRLRHADGTWRWMEGVGTNLLHEPIINGIIANVRDVTDRRRTEDLLRESEQRFALAVDGTKDGIWDWHRPTGIFYVSPRMREILALDPLETPVVTDLFDARVHPEDLARVRVEWEAHLKSQDRHYEAEYRLRLPDGSYRWLLARSATVRDAQGQPLRMVGSLSDITPRKRAEDEARQRQAELAHVLRVAAMGEMAAGLAHELNQPLAAIVNYARGCARRLGENYTDATLLEVLDRIATEALRAGDVVRGLKRVIRKEPPHESYVDLNEVARDAASMVRAEASERAIELTLELSPDRMPVRGDRIQIEQVILNLLRNATEAISRPPGTVRLRTECSDSRAQVSITDSGDGITAELRERVFAPFFTTKTSGLGMGLSISRTIIEAHGGRLWAEDDAQHGTTFSFSLPICADGDGAEPLAGH